MTEKVWMITGASRGLGRLWAEAALERGDKVIATARTVADLSALGDKFGGRVLALPLDVTDREAAFAAVKRGHENFGRIDVLITNAAFAINGAIEESGEKDSRDLFETNVLGALWVSQAVLPVFRSQKSGHIIAISSVGGMIGVPVIGLYTASKWALEGMMDSLYREVQHLGIKVTIAQLSAFETEFGTPKSLRLSPSLDDYNRARSVLMDFLGSVQVEKPSAAAEPMLKLVDEKDPPLRKFIGKVELGWILRQYAERFADWTRS